MADVKVQSNVALPVSRRGRQKQDVGALYPFADMRVGDCFIISGKKDIYKARNAAQTWVKDHGDAWKFSTRELTGTPIYGEDGKATGEVYPAETFGVWRVMRTVDAPAASAPIEPTPVLTVNPEHQS